MESPKDIKEFIRNPLGIVALFISLIYGFASLLLGAAAGKLESPERWPLIGFIVFFPFTVLLVFYKLVTEHHGKLYGPGDYKSDDAFLRTLTSEERTQKLIEEVEEATGTPVSELMPPNPTEANKIKPTKIASRVEEKIIRSEQYVISKIENELNIAPIKDVKISKHGYSFDAGYIVQGKSATFVEVKYITRPHVNALVVKELVYRAQLVAESMKIETNFIFALVCEFDTAESRFVQDIWTKILSSSTLKYELRIYQARDVFA